MTNMKEAFEKAGFKNEKKNNPPGGSAPKTSTSFNLDDHYVERAEQVILDLKQSMGRNFKSFTTSKIRNILAQVSEIYNDVVIEKEDYLNDDILSRIEYLKVRLVYESGREPDIVKPFVEKAGLLILLKNIGTSKENFVKYAHYMEALVAYHRFYGGKDK